MTHESPDKTNAIVTAVDAFISFASVAYLQELNCPPALVRGLEGFNLTR
jgi:hypothetical protein